MKIYGNVSEETAKHLKYIGLYVFRQIAIYNYANSK